MNSNYYFRLVLKAEAFINAMNYNLLIISDPNIHVMINDKLYNQSLAL